MYRPTSVTVIAILNLGFGALGLCGMAMFGVMYVVAQSVPPGEPSPLGPGAGNPFVHDDPWMQAWLQVSIGLGSIAAIVQIVAGVGLLQMRSWARVLSVGYGVYGVIMAALGTAISLKVQVLPVFHEVDPSPALVGQAVGGVLGGCFSFVLPAATWFFMTRPHVKAAFRGEGPPLVEQVEDVEGLVAALEAAPTESDNPFASPRTSAAPVHPTGPTAAGEHYSGLIPTKNPAALWSYYLGLFSLLPVCGSPMGLVAVVLGIKGLQRARAEPAVLGRGHAWVGIVCGSLFGLFNTLLLVGIVIGVVVEASR